MLFICIIIIKTGQREIAVGLVQHIDCYCEGGT